MIEIVAALVGGVIGSVLTLVCSSIHEYNAIKKERGIIKSTLLSECEVQNNVLNVLEEQYMQSRSVNPARLALDLFEYGLSRHMAILGDIRLIQKLSYLIINSRALNNTLDSYESELLKAMDDARRLPNVEKMRLSICKSIRSCRVSMQAVQVALEHVDDRGTDPIGGVEMVE